MTKEQIEEWYKNLKNVDIQTFKDAINKLAKKNRFMPTLAEIKDEIPKKNIENLNLNSSYWYRNLREWCEKNNMQYYDITNGEPLPAYKR